MTLTGTPEQPPVDVLRPRLCWPQMPGDWAWLVGFTLQEKHWSTTVENPLPMESIQPKIRSTHSPAFAGLPCDCPFHLKCDYDRNVRLTLGRPRAPPSPISRAQRYLLWRKLTLPRGLCFLPCALLLIWTSEAEPGCCVTFCLRWPCTYHASPLVQTHFVSLREPGSLSHCVEKEPSKAD